MSSSSSFNSSDSPRTKVEWGFLKKLFLSNLGFRFITIPLIIFLLFQIGRLRVLHSIDDNLSNGDIHLIEDLELHNDDAIYKNVGDQMVVSLRSPAPFDVIVDRQEAPVAARQKFDRRYYVENIDAQASEGIRIAKATKWVRVIDIRGKGTVTAESAYGLPLGAAFLYELFFFIVCVVCFFSFLLYSV